MISRLLRLGEKNFIILEIDSITAWHCLFVNQKWLWLSCSIGERDDYKQGGAHPSGVLGSRTSKPFRAKKQGAIAILAMEPVRSSLVDARGYNTQEDSTLARVRKNVSIRCPQNKKKWF